MTSLEGSKAPDFTLAGSDGNTHTLRAYRGKTVVLYFYPKDDTPGCTKEACAFRDLFGAIGKRAVVLGVSRDTLGSHEAFIARHKLPFVLLSDPDAKAMRAYGAYGDKLMYGKPVVGVIRSTVVIGPDGKVRRHWGSVRKADEHPAEVLAFLQGEKP
jgi:peroxiredoxin Q/BCP